MSARASDVVFCMRSLNTADQGVSANTIMSVITPEYVPGLFSFSIVITLLGISPVSPHHFELCFGPIDCEPEKFTAELVPNVGTTTGNLPDDYQGINVAIDLNNFNFAKSGLYQLVVFVDSERVTEKQIYVKGKNE